MFGLGITEILLILTIALLVLGPEKLPETARQLGRMVGNFRSALDGIRDDFDLSDTTRGERRAPSEDKLLVSTSLTNTTNTCEESSNSAEPKPKGQVLSEEQSSKGEDKE